MKLWLHFFSESGRDDRIALLGRKLFEFLRKEFPWKAIVALKPIDEIHALAMGRTKRPRGEVLGHFGFGLAHGAADLHSCTSVAVASLVLPEQPMQSNGLDIVILETVVAGNFKWLSIVNHRLDFMLRQRRERAEEPTF